MTTQAYLDNLKAEAAALKGKRGAPAIRARHEKLAKIHRQHQYSLGAALPPAQTPDERKLKRLASFLGSWNLARVAAMTADERQAAIEGRLLERQKLALLGSAASEVALDDLKGGYTALYARLGEWYVRSYEDAEKDWNAYSKAWHRSYGPKVTVTARRVIFTRPKGRYGVERREVEVAAWRGHWLLNAAIEAGIVQPHRGLAHVRLHPAYDAELIRETRGHRLYRRTLAGDFVDFVLVSPLGQTFHAPTVAEAFAGLRSKLEAKAREKVATLTFAYARKLGFCEAGIKEFARAFSLDIRGRYTPDEIAAAVRADPEAAAPYLPELRTLAEAVGYRAPELAA